MKVLLIACRLSGGVGISRPLPKEHQQIQTPNLRVIKDESPRNRKQGTPELKQDSMISDEGMSPAQTNLVGASQSGSGVISGKSVDSDATYQIFY